MQLKKVGEFGLIDTISRLTARHNPSVIKGIGDDAAVIRQGVSDCLLVTTDTLVEDIHFILCQTTPYLLGKKCVSVNFSDIAAMGGVPRYYTVSLSVPAETPCGFVTSLYRGMDSQAKRFSAVLLGGDTTGTRGGISVSVTALGTARTDQVLYRSGACPGDLICVTGTLGDAALGLEMLAEGSGVSRRNTLVRKHLDPVPRVAEARAIAGLKAATSMIDISDGLLADLGHILDQSRAGARISLPALPLSGAYRKRCRAAGRDFFREALCGGEDYELLFTIRPDCRAAVERLVRKHGTSVACIGHITGTPSELVVWDESGKPAMFAETGYSHFQV